MFKNLNMFPYIPTGGRKRPQGSTPPIGGGGPGGDNQFRLAPGTWQGYDREAAKRALAAIKDNKLLIKDNKSLIKDNLIKDNKSLTAHQAEVIKKGINGYSKE